MSNKSTHLVRLSSEFWAIIGSAVAVGALVLTVSGWHRGDIQGLRVEMGSMEAGLRGDMGNLESNLRGEMSNLETNLRGEMVNLEGNLRGDMKGLEAGLRGEIKAVDEKLSAKIDKLERGQAGISARLAVVESHVLGASGMAGEEGVANPAP